MFRLLFAFLAGMLLTGTALAFHPYEQELQRFRDLNITGIEYHDDTSFWCGGQANVHCISFGTGIVHLWNGDPNLGDPHWLNAVLSHEACHRHLYNNGLLAVGPHAEVVCYTVQKIYLESMGDDSGRVTIPQWMLDEWPETHW